MRKVIATAEIERQESCQLDQSVTNNQASKWISSCNANLQEFTVSPVTMNLTEIRRIPSFFSPELFKDQVSNHHKKKTIVLLFTVKVVRFHGGTSMFRTPIFRKKMRHFPAAATKLASSIIGRRRPKRELRRSDRSPAKGPRTINTGVFSPIGKHEWTTKKKMWPYYYWNHKRVCSRIAYRTLKSQVFFHSSHVNLQMWKENERNIWRIERMTSKDLKRWLWSFEVSTISLNGNLDISKKKKTWKKDRTK